MKGLPSTITVQRCVTDPTADSRGVAVRRYISGCQAVQLALLGSVDLDFEGVTGQPDGLFEEKLRQLRCGTDVL